MLKGSKENGLHSRFWESDRSRSTFSIPCLPDGTFDSPRSWPVDFILLRRFLHQLMNHQWWLTLFKVCVEDIECLLDPPPVPFHPEYALTTQGAPGQPKYFFAAHLFSYRYIVQDSEGYRIRRWPSFCRLLWLVKWQVHQNWITASKSGQHKSWITDWIGQRHFPAMCWAWGKILLGTQQSSFQETTSQTWRKQKKSLQSDWNDFPPDTCVVLPENSKWQTAPIRTLSHLHVFGIRHGAQVILWDR